MRLLSVPQPFHRLASWRGHLVQKEKWVVTAFFYGYHSSALVEQSMELKHGDQIWMISDGVFQETIELDVQEQQYMAWWTEESPTAAEFMEWKTRFFRTATDDQTVICLHVSKRLPSWSLFTPRQVTRVVN